MSNNTLPEGQLLIQNSLLGYPKLYEAKVVNNDPNGKPRYGCQIYLPKSDESTKAKIDKEINRLVKLHLKGVKPKSKDLCIKDGDGEDNRDEHAKGHWIISANRGESQGRPQIIDRKQKPIDSKDSSDVYAGSVCNFLISLYVPKRGNTNQVAACLEIVQKVRDGEPFGAARVVASQVMPELPEEEDDFEA
jgi:hypothetical protein